MQNQDENQNYETFPLVADSPRIRRSSSVSTYFNDLSRKDWIYKIFTLISMTLFCVAIMLLLFFPLQYLYAQIIHKSSNFSSPEHDWTSEDYKTRGLNFRRYQSKIISSKGKFDQNLTLTQSSRDLSSFTGEKRIIDILLYHDGFKVFVVSPGDKVSITLVNKLKGKKKVSNENLKTTENMFRFPSITNLHWHGVHASPEKEDNVFDIISPGKSRIYNYKISDTHPTGNRTYFLHSHFHGSSTYQTANGLAIPIIIKDIDSRNEDNILGSVREENDITMLIGFLNLNTGSAQEKKTTNYFFWKHFLLHEDISEGKNHVLNQEFLTLNGENARISFLEVEEKTWYRFRFINAVVDGNINLVFNGFRNEHGNCVLHNIAADGVTFDSARKFSLNETQTVLIPSGSRKDFIFGCLEISKSAMFKISSVSDKTITKYLGTGSNILQGELLTLIPKNSRIVFSKRKQKQFKNFFEAETLALNGSPQKTTSKEINEDPTFIVNYTFGGENTPKALLGHGLSINTRNETATEYNYTFYGVNGVKYSETPLTKVELDKPQYWKIVNQKALDGSDAIESHPFHIHTNHFRVVSIEAEEPETKYLDFQIGDIRDTISIPPKFNITISFTPKDYIGRSLAHCHTFAHADTGMLFIFDILKP
eukprot:snap_masked-scaffold_3-processed-gene-11.23-mRNA-1 protein AED:0.46 eAED:0.46 QI:0/0/0/0.2/1/1/5/0/649